MSDTYYFVSTASIVNIIRESNREIHREMKKFLPDETIFGVGQNNANKIFLQISKKKYLLILI